MTARQDKIKEYEIITKRIDKAEKWFRDQPDDFDIDNSKEYQFLLELIEKANKLHKELYLKA